MKFAEQEIMIFANEYGYSTGVSRKNQNDEYIKTYIPVNFRKGVTVENKTTIKIKDAWLSLYEKKTEDKKKVLYIFVNEFDIVK